MGISPAFSILGRHACNCGGLVFSGSNEGNFFALDASTGKPLWEIYLGAALRSNPVTYAVDGKHRVFVTAGTTCFVFGLA